jgi:hypothetical protein
MRPAFFLPFAKSRDAANTGAAPVYLVQTYPLLKS